MKKEKSLEEITAGTLSGDLRDVMLTHIRSMEDPWSKLSESKQQDKIYAVQNACEEIVRRAVRIIAADQRDVIDVKVDKFTVKDTIKMEVAANVTTPNIEHLAENRGRSAILMFVTAADYIGQKAEAKGEPDQPALPIDDEDTEKADLDNELPAVDPADAPEAA